MRKFWGAGLLCLVALMGYAQEPAAREEAPGIVKLERVQLPAVLAYDPARFAELAAEAPSEPGGLAQAGGVVRDGWWRIQPDRSLAEPRLLVYQPHGARVRVLSSAGESVQDAFRRDLDRQYARSALVFAVDGQGPLLMQVEGARHPLKIAVQSRSQHLADSLDQTRWLGLAVGLLAGLALAVFLHWIMLHERVYLLYPAAVSLQLLYVLCLHGEAYALPGFRWLARFGAPGIGFIGMLVTIASVYLLLDYAELRKRAPRLSRALWQVGVLLPALLLLALVLPWPADKSWFSWAADPLTVGTHVLMMVALAYAWRQGARLAGFMLVAWLPLATISVGRFVQLSRDQAVVPWMENSLVLALVFSAVVLALGLADRMLGFRRERDHAKEHALRDALTGVFNRAGIEHRIDWAILNSRAERESLSLLFLDLDNFKRINDNFGHAVGDSCLRAVVRTVSAELQYGDQFGRLGGEEFVLALAASGTQRAMNVAERIRRRVERNCMQVDGAPVGLTLSIGVAECHRGDTVASLIERADKAMYAAKHAGRNRVILLDIYGEYARGNPFSPMPLK